MFLTSKQKNVIWSSVAVVVIGAGTTGVLLTTGEEEKPSVIATNNDPVVNEPTEEPDLVLPVVDDGIPSEGEPGYEPPRAEPGTTPEKKLDGSDVSLNSPEDNFDRGLVAFEQGDKKTALLYFESAATSQNPDISNRANSFIGEIEPTSEEVSVDYSDKTAQGDPDQNYSKGLASQANGDISSALEYFRSAAKSDDKVISNRAKSFLGPLERIAKGEGGTLIVVSSANIRDEERFIAESGNFTLDGIDFPVQSGDVVVVSKGEYQVTVTIRQAGGEQFTSILAMK